MTGADKLTRLNHLYAVSSGINEAIVRIPDERRLYEEACRVAVDKGGLMMAWVGLLDCASDTLRPVASAGKDDGYVQTIRVSISEREPEGRGPGGEAFRTGRAAVCNDIAADNYFFASKAEALARGYRSCAAFALQMGGRSTGVFLVYAAQPMYFDQEELQLLTALAENFSFAIEARHKEQERRVSTEKLQQSQALLSMASRLGRIGAWSLDVQSLQVTWSEELGVIYERPPGFAPSFAQAAEFFAPPHREAVMRTFQECMEHGTPFDVELEITTGSGRLVWVRSIGEAVRDAAGAVCKVQGALQDISERKKAESEIRHLADRLVNTLESVTDAFITVDRDWIFTYVNREAERLLQRDRAGLLGRNMWVEFPAGRGSAFEAAYARAVAENRSVEIEEFFAPLGAWLEVRIYPSHQGLTIYFRDVSERRRSQDEILRLNAELEQRVRQRTAQLERANGELEAFSYSVAHDLRAPLAAISGFAHALETELGTSANPRVQHYLHRAREGVRQTGQMIDALLSLARLSRAELRWEPVDLSAIARTVLEDFRLREPAGEAVLTVHEGLQAHGDARLLQLVIDNLVGNAWKFSAQQAARAITVGAQQAGDGERVYFVRDNGVGFDMAHASNLFGAFQRLHSQAEFAGTGVGLANVRRITSRHSGRIWAESQPGQGATFYFTLGDEPA